MCLTVSLLVFNMSLIIQMLKPRNFHTISLIFRSFHSSCSHKSSVTWRSSSSSSRYLIARLEYFTKLLHIHYLWFAWCFIYIKSPWKITKITLKHSHFQQDRLRFSTMDRNSRNIQDYKLSIRKNGVIAYSFIRTFCKLHTYALKLFKIPKISTKPLKSRKSIGHFKSYIKKSPYLRREYWVAYFFSLPNGLGWP